MAEDEPNPLIKETVESSSAKFPPPEQDEAEAGAQKGLEFILDISLTISARLGSTKMMIRDLLQLGHGSIVELDKLAGEPLEILVNDKLIARGEVVVVNEKFGVRLTEVVSAMERVQQLQ
jgi:flagellar motor switch protein FliN/FliY